MVGGNFPTLRLLWPTLVGGPNQVSIEMNLVAGYANCRIDSRSRAAHCNGLFASNGCSNRALNRGDLQKQYSRIDEAIPLNLILVNFGTPPSVHSEGGLKSWKFPIFFSTVHFDYVWELWNNPIIFSICPFWGRIGSQCLSAIEPTIATALHNIEAQILPRSIINKHSLFGVFFTTRDISNKRIPGLGHLWQGSRQCQPSSLSNQ